MSIQPTNPYQYSTRLSCTSNHPQPRTYWFRLPEYAASPGRMRQIAENRTITVERSSSYSSLIRKLHGQMLSRAKMNFLPQKKRDSIRSFKEIITYLLSEIYKHDEQDLVYLDSFLCDFKITQEDLDIVLKTTSFPKIETEQSYVRAQVNKLYVEPFVRFLRSSIQKAYFYKRLEIYLSRLPITHLNQTNHKDLFRHCKRYSDDFQARHIPDDRMKIIVKGLLDFEKKRRANTIVNRLTENLQCHLFEISDHELKRLTPEFLFDHYEKTYGSILRLTSDNSYLKFYSNIESMLQEKQAKQLSKADSPILSLSSSAPGSAE